MAWGNALCHSFMRMQNVDTEPPDEKNDLLRQIDAL